MIGTSVERPLNAAAGGAVGAIAGNMLLPDSLLGISVAAGLGAAVSEYIHPISFTGNMYGPYAGSAQAYNYKLAVGAGALTYAQSYVNAFSGVLGTGQTQTTVHGAVAGALACVIMTLSGGKLLGY